MWWRKGVYRKQQSQSKWNIDIEEWNKYDETCSPIVSIHNTDVQESKKWNVSYGENNSTHSTPVCRPTLCRVHDEKITLIFSKETEVMTKSRICCYGHILNKTYVHYHNRYPLSKGILLRQNSQSSWIFFCEVFWSFFFSFFLLHHLQSPRILLSSPAHSI